MTTPTVAEILPPRQRKRAYVLYSCVAVAIAGALAGFASIAADAPPALIFASAFVNVVGAGLGLVAAGNTPAPSKETP